MPWIDNNRSSLALRERGHPFELPIYKYDLTRKSFIMRALYDASFILAILQIINYASIVLVVLLCLFFECIRCAFGYYHQSFISFLLSQHCVVV